MASGPAQQWGTLHHYNALKKLTGDDQDDQLELIARLRTKLVAGNDSRNPTTKAIDALERSVTILRAGRDLCLQHILRAEQLLMDVRLSFGDLDGVPVQRAAIKEWHSEYLNFTRGLAKSIMERAMRAFEHQAWTDSGAGTSWIDHAAEGDESGRRRSM